MGPVIISLFVTAAVFFMVALTHFMVWSRANRLREQLLFSATCLSNGVVVVTMAGVYQAMTVAAMIPALRLQISIVGLSLIALIWFVQSWTPKSALQRRMSVVFTVGYLVLMLINLVADHGLHYVQIDGLREILLPWEESIALAQGAPSNWQFLVITVQLGTLMLVANGTRLLWRQGERRRAFTLGGSLLIYMLINAVYGLLLDVGIINLPWLDPYAFLLVVLVMSHELAGEVVRALRLSKKVQADEKRWRSLLEGVKLLVIGVDRDGRIEYVNPFFQQVSGYSTAEVMRQSYAMLLPAGRTGRVREDFSAASTDLLADHSEVKLLTKDGYERIIIWSNVRLYDQADEIAGVLSVGADITERRDAEAARDQALRDLQQVLSEVGELKNRLQDQVVYLQEEIHASHNFKEIIGDSDALKYLFHKIEQVAALDTTVLIEGETGVGKELVARAIHDLSPRKELPLVKVNCAALPANLIESELFGHEKGAFTGAGNRRKGMFELADHGTLFLDEIGELPLELQPKLLRVLQEGEVQRVGGSQMIKVDVRVLAATNRRLQEAIRQGQFREDLYYRLNVYPVTVPPLRQRKDDIPVLVNAFVSRFSKLQGKAIETITQAAMEQLQHYHWPGNVRELINVIERAVITSSGKALQLAETLVNPDGLAIQQDVSAPQAVASNNSGNGSNYCGTLEEVERGYITKVLQQSQWRIEGEAGAAELLGLNPSTLRSRMRKLNIKRPAVNSQH